MARNEWLHRECSGWYEGDFLGHHLTVRKVVPEGDTGYSETPYWVFERGRMGSWDDKFATKREALRAAEKLVLAIESERMTIAHESQS